MLDVRTFLRVGPGAYMPLSDVRRICPRNPGHVLGYVLVESANGTLLGENYVTDVNFWWAQIPQMLDQLVNNGDESYVGFIPDLPIEIRWSRDGSLLRWEVIGRELAFLQTPFEASVNDLCKLCRDFFEKLSQSYPESPDDYSPVLKMLSRVRPR